MRKFKEDSVSIPNDVTLLLFSLNDVLDWYEKVFLGHVP